jgi:FtsH-binding integral membrane protein
MNTNYSPNTQKDYYNNDFEMNLNPVNDYMQREIRLGFIKKVYGILSTQLLITTLFTLLSMTSTQFSKFQMEHIGIVIFCLILTLILPCVIVCFQSTMRKTPNNYIILGTFTLAESYIVSFICSLYNPRVVLMAAFMTFALVASLTIYAMTTKTDFTTQGGLLFVLGCGLFMFSMFAMFTSNKLVHIILCVVGIVLFGLYLLYDTQLILGNKENVLEIDDYILASFMLYTDIIYLFLRILELIQLLTGGNNN